MLFQLGEKKTKKYLSRRTGTDSNRMGYHCIDMLKWSDGNKDARPVAISICTGSSHVARTNPCILTAFLERFASHIYKLQWVTASLMVADSNVVLLYEVEVLSHL
jgi:hypothetical protein